MVGQFMIIFFAVLIVLAAIGFWMKKRAQKKGTYTEKARTKYWRTSLTGAIP